VRDDDGGSGAGDASHVVMLGNPDALVTPLLSVGREVAGVMQGGGFVTALGHTNQFEQGEHRHRQLTFGPWEGFLTARVRVEDIITIRFRNVHS
jgi:hypothetical protein